MPKLAFASFVPAIMGLILAEGASVAPAAAASLAITPASVSLSASQSQSFMLNGAGAADPVVWSVNGVTGGNTQVGTITTKGFYHAPAQVSAAVTVVVTALDAGVLAQASVMLVVSGAPPPPVVVTVLPVAASVTVNKTQQFTSAVTGASNTSVTWAVNGVAGGNATVGTVSASGLFTAPSAVPSAPAVKVTTTSVADPTKSATAVATIAVPVNVTVSPASASLVIGGTEQFTGTVTGTANTAVKWTVSPAVGTVSTTGLYTAPTIISSPQTVTVTATSVVDTSKSARGSVGLVPFTSGMPAGLVSYPSYTPGANLLVNPDFETAAANGITPANWTDNGFALDATVSKSGTKSYRVVNPYLIPYAQSAWQDLFLQKGTYEIAGWIKTSGLGATRTGSVRICLSAPNTYPPIYGSGCTALTTGTADWTYFQQTDISVASDTMARFSMGVYGEPDGTAWFDSVELRRQKLPLQVFMQYPNYRGQLFDDQPQSARFTVQLDATDVGPLSAYLVSATVTDESTGGVVIQNSIAAAASFTTNLDFGGLAMNKPYLAKFKLVNAATGAEVPSTTFPAYRIVKASGAVRNAMNVSVDAQNRFLLKGVPSFLLGVYDSGLGYTSLESSWQSTLTTERRLFELPINLYLNYWYGNAANASMMPLMNVLQTHGISMLTNANCSGSVAAAATGPNWFLQSTDDIVAQRSTHPGFAGYYAADECQAPIAADVFANYQRMQRLDPGGVALGTLLPNFDLPFWRDSVDILATDPYPIVGAQPATGYPLSAVSDAARAVNNALFGSRPFVMTLQFFLGTSNSHWPTYQEIRSMSYAAITEGANGLFYWSLGAGALAYICDGSDAAHSPAGSSSWCQVRIDEFTNLKTVLTEIQALEPALVTPDRPDLLVGNSNGAIHTRVKATSAASYMIAFNTAATPQTVTLQWAQPLHSVALQNTGLPVTAVGSQFTDTFGPYEARVYVIY
jgi:hypothetical protein